ncbi:MAG: hypothetical protein MI919_10270 [Holophagales bacterium]|nr:hypothetical protein [Holophagales bacterium]
MAELAPPSLPVLRWLEFRASEALFWISVLCVLYFAGGTISQGFRFWAIVAGVHFGLIVGVCSPTRLRLSQRLPSTWRHFCGTPIGLLMVLAMAVTLVATLWARPDTVDPRVFALRLFFWSGCSALTVFVAASVRIRDLPLVPMLAIPLLMTSSLSSPSPAQELLTLGLASTTTLCFALSTAVTSWRRLAVGGWRVEAYEGDRGTSGRGGVAPFAEIDSILIFVVALASAQAILPDGLSALRAALYPTAIWIAAKSAVRLSRGDSAVDRLCARLGLDSLLSWSLLGIFVLFLVVRGWEASLAISGIDPRSGLPEALTPPRVYRAWLAALLLLWAVTERAASRKAGAFSRQLAMARRAPLTRVELTARVVGAVGTPISKGLLGVVFVTLWAAATWETEAFVPRSWSEAVLLSLLLAGLALVTSIFAGAGMVVLGFEKVARWLIAASLFGLFFVTLIPDTRWVDAPSIVAVHGLLLLAVFLTIYFHLDPTSGPTPDPLRHGSETVPDPGRTLRSSHGGPEPDR